MKKSILLFLFITLFTNTFYAQKQLDSLWKQVEDFELKELPRSALTIVDSIYKLAVKKNNTSQTIKALIYKSKFSLVLNENAQLTIIQDFKTHIDKSSTPTKNILNNMLANFYWQYFKKNRYKFYNRTKTTQKIDSTDFRTWNLNLIFKEAHLHYQKALLNKEQLLKVSDTIFSDFLSIKKDSEDYRPTLYDFLAHNALEFYKTPEHSIDKPTYQFNIDSLIYFSDSKSFSNLKIDTKDDLSLEFNALKIYQNLIRAHLKLNNKKALALINLERLKFVNNKKSTKIARNTLLNALIKVEKKYRNIDIGGIYNFEIASIYNNDTQVNQKEKALKICSKVIEQFPNSIGAKKCLALKKIIEEKSLNLTAEKFLPINRFSRILINYKNIDSLYFNSYKITQQQREKLNKIYNLNEIRLFIKKLKKVHHWTKKLKTINDYKQHSTEVIVPKHHQGMYLIIASENKKLTNKTIFGSSIVQVSNISLIEHNDNGKYIFQVVNRNNGAPIKNAIISINNPKKVNSSKINKVLKTNKNGWASFKSKASYNSCEINVHYKKDKAYFGSHFLEKYTSTREAEKDISEYDSEVLLKPFIFTDKSIYRPGQTLYFKAIVLKRQRKKSTLFKNEFIKITFSDTNGQEIKSLDIKLNEFGSVSGEFKIPDNGLTGEFSIGIDESKKVTSRFYNNVDFDFDYYSEKIIYVEEYKRPKFKADFKPVKEVFAINDSITIKGFANSFAGSTITNAKVTYKIRRKTTYPTWFYWKNYNNYTSTQEIAFGKTSTDNKGEFQFTFKALADTTVPKSNQPTFTYQITAHVTDINGETRSASTTVKVGYHTINLTLDAPTIINKNKSTTLLLKSENLNGEFTPIKGTLTIHKLIAPNTPLRERVWDAPDFQDISEKTFRELFPNDPYKQEEANVKHWKKGIRIFNVEFDTSKKKEIILNRLNKYISGKYIITLKATDQNGLIINDQKIITLFSYNDTSIADNQLFSITTNKAWYKPKDYVALKLSSASKDITISLQIEKNKKVKKTILVHLNNESKIVKIPVKDKDVGGFVIKYHYVNYNSFDKGSIAIHVPKKERSIDIQTNTFRDKIQPGQNETWSFTIKDDKNNSVSTEVLASMYDASLDEFKKHRWVFTPSFTKPYGSYNYTNANNSFGSNRFRIRNKKYYYLRYPQFQFTSYNWFGLHLYESRWRTKQYLRKLKRIRETQKEQSQVNVSGKFNGIINGVISDNIDGLPGANVAIKGANIGTLTDFDGSYQIKAKKGDVLVFSYIGYITLEVTVGSQSTINATLKEDENVLDEVVVTGYGIKKESSTLGYAVNGKTSGIFLKKKVNKNHLIKKLSSVKARTNFNETAFFYPQLRTDKKGKISFNFTIPEALTQWKLQLLAHTKSLGTASKELTTITQKELMVTPNTPRFLRQGDTIKISAKITNLTNNQLNGVAQLSLTNAITGKTIDTDLNNIKKNKDFTVNKEGNTSVSWTITIPSSIEAVQYKIVATSGNFSDGEQRILPVLSNRILITETLPLMVRSNQTKIFTLKKLKNNTSTTLKNHKLTLEMTSNPAWNAVHALPYLMEYPYDCAEQTFSKFYANSLASFIANSNPKIKQVFNHWKSSKTFISNLEKNKELKSLIINETPWLRDALSETEQKKRIGLLFDLNTMTNEKDRAINKLKDMQLSNGGFPWFKGSSNANRFISQHIVTGFGHLKKLGVTKLGSSTLKMISKTVNYLDLEISKEYSLVLKKAKKFEKEQSKNKADDYLKNYRPSYFVIQYLYMRSFYTSIKINQATQEAINYYLKQSTTFRSEFNLYGKAQIALINYRSGKINIAKNILKSLQENSITTEELGMYWKSNIAGYRFFQSEIETQALIIEAFSEIENNKEIIDNLKIWLLKNKQTNQWKTTIATSKAIFALLLNNTNWISDSNTVDITVGNEKINSEKLKNATIENGSGYYKISWNKKEITPDLSNIKLVKKQKGISWGAMYWQYFENSDKVTFSKSPLQIDKKLFLKTNTNQGEQLDEITSKTALKIGDIVTIRIVIKSDRSMEFIHMKDMRASSFEPIDVLSKYKWQDGLGYYQSTKDASTNFFFDFLPKGIHVFEYNVRVNNSGKFSNGITTIQSMYAPEFSSHSKGIRVNIK